MSRVLIVEDEEHLARGLKLNLEAEGFAAEVEENGEVALQRLVATGAGASGFDVVLLDVMLPGLDGFEVVRRLRAARQFVPVMLLTARSDNDDVLRGFEAGADDYLSKPFDLSILLARIAGLLRRRTWLRGDAAGQEQKIEEYRFAGRSIDFRNQVLRRDGVEQPLTVMEATPARLPGAARRGDRLPQGAPGGGLGRAPRHRHPDRRQLHRPPAALHRGQAGPPAASADRARRRLPVRRESGRRRVVDR